MYTEKQQERIFKKLENLERRLDGKLFTVVDTVPVDVFQTDGSYHSIPPRENFTPCEEGQTFSGEGIYCWFRCEFTVPESLAGKSLYVNPRIWGYEGLLWVNGKPFGNFASRFLRNSHGNHYCDMICKEAKAGETIDLAMEYYANHEIRGTQTLRPERQMPFRIVGGPADICVKNEEVWDFYFDLKTANEMVKTLPKESFIRAGYVRALIKVDELVSLDYDNEDPEVFAGQIAEADEILKEALSHKNADSAPYAGLIGHSHMDTAWLWHRGETEKKCARTYSNQMSLMEQYPEYTFIQSSAYHSDIIKRMYPDLFEDMKQRVQEGRYEPNGGVWIECDCNIPGGEYMIRQFVWGQKFTRENFSYTSDAFWLPDTFGYSASLPQILKGCGIKYFLTTKIAWNDTNVFPYDTFYWKGIDGSQVLVHFNRTHVWPDPKTLSENLLENGDNTIKERAVSDRRLISYGFGDGGGGPEFGMIEMARRVEDLEGMPRTEHTTVSHFMQGLEESLVDPSTYRGELYLELHRGTLTNQHTIKRNNRKAEFALHDLEYLTVRDAIAGQKCASGETIAPLMNEMLINQFHDILPGTCIPRAHDEAIAAVSHVIEESCRMSEEILENAAHKAEDGALTMTLVNTLSFARKDVVYLPFDGKHYVKGYVQQVTKDLDGKAKLAVLGVEIPAFGSVTLQLTDTYEPGECVFRAEGNVLETPLVRVTFSEKGYLSSYIDKRNGRELKGEGYDLNTFLMGEDVSLEWDNWDIDADLAVKMKDRAQLLSREVISAGEVEYRIRSTYRLSAKSMLTQDMIFTADSCGVVFETRINWQEEHQFLKTAFDTSIHAEYASHEIQFGYIRRTVNRNTSIEKARFEVSNHKYTDLSETRYGAAVLNDCKYGISVEDSSMRLSLHKGGCLPDYRGDKGVHDCTYAFLPHMGSLSAESVICPAYRLNEKPLVVEGSLSVDSLVSLDTDHVIVETIKPMEQAGRGFILRMYEAEGAQDTVELTFGVPVKSIARTNMLEEVKEDLGAAQSVRLTIHPFEIITLRVGY